MAETEPTQSSADVEELERRLSALKRERERLRASAAGRNELERNRREIAQAQRQLSIALIARHSPAFQAA